MWKEKLDCRCEGRKKGCGGKGGQLSTVGVQEVGKRKDRDVLAAQGGSRIVLPQMNDHSQFIRRCLFGYTVRSRKKHWWRRPEEDICNKLD